MKSKSHDVKTSIFALGEAANLIVNKKITLSAQDLISLFESQNIQICHVERPLSELLTAIEKLAYTMRPMDQLILACGLCDGSSKGLLTFDSKFMHNKGLPKVLSSGLCNSSFVVSDEPFV